MSFREYYEIFYSDPILKDALLKDYIDLPHKYAQSHTSKVNDAFNLRQVLSNVFHSQGFHLFKPNSKQIVTDLNWFAEVINTIMDGNNQQIFGVNDINLRMWKLEDLKKALLKNLAADQVSYF